MPNPLYQMLGQQSTPMGQMIQQFQRFRQQFTGDPRQKVQELLNSGRMSQAQFNQLQAAAKQFQQMLR